MISAGKYYLNKQKRSTGIPMKDIIHIAVKSMGLDDLSPFDSKEKIIEYRISEEFGPIASMKLHEFSDELSSESPAPGGGSVSALSGVLGASLSSMVANLTFGKKKWLPLYDQMSQVAQKSQQLKNELIKLIDTDTESFKGVIEAYNMPKNTDNQIIDRTTAIDHAMKEATNIPFKTLKYCRDIMELALEAAQYGNPNSISDAGVSGEMANAGARSASLNVFINLKEINDNKFCKEMDQKTHLILDETNVLIVKIRKVVAKVLNNV